MIDQSAALLEGLNPAQQAAVSTISGPVLVVAGPGSGKTRVLTHRIAYCIFEGGVTANRIMAVTFTNKAAREMRERIDRLIGSDASSGLVMGTFHSFGVRLLRQNPGVVADRLGLQPNFLIYDDGDQQALAKQAVLAVGLDPKVVAPRRMTSKISAAKGLFMSPDDVAAAATTYDDELVARVYREYDRGLRKAAAVDFDDLLTLPIRLFDEAPALLERYQERYVHILVDEYQDTNRVQYVLVSALAARHRNLFVVGDPDQSIYAWRQADIRNILEFEQDFPDAKRIDLETNYRSTRRIVEAADSVIRVNTQRIDRRLKTDNPLGAPINVRELADQGHEGSFVVSEIRRLIQSGGRSGDQIAIMYRTTAQSRALEESFRTSDVPYRIVGGLRFYERKEIKDIMAVFRLVHNPNDGVSLNRVIDNLPIGRGFGPKAMEVIADWSVRAGVPALEGFLRLAHAVLESHDAPALSGNAKSAAQRIGSVFAKLREQAGQVSLPELFDLIIEHTNYESSIDQSIESDMERWGNVLELRNDLAKFEGISPSDALATYLEQVALVADVDSMETDSSRPVTLITLHSAKGLEFPVVFLVGVEDGLLPISRAVEAEFTDPLPMEEERRLFYVGITRAMDVLYITHASSRMNYGRYQQSTPSRFLASIPEHSIQSVGRSGRRTSSPNERGQERDRNSSWGSTSSSSASSSPWTSNRNNSTGSPGGGWSDSPSAVSKTPEPTPLPDFKVGQRVFHAKFGEGTITKVVMRRDDAELGVKFNRHGDKNLMATLANLDVIE